MASALMQSVRASRHALCSGLWVASRRCCARRPHGPGADPFGKLSNASMTSSGEKVAEVGVGRGVERRCPSGCLVFRRLRVCWLSGAGGSARRAAAAGPRWSSSTSANALRREASEDGLSLARGRLTEVASCHSCDRSPFNQRSTLCFVCWADNLRCFRPQRAAGIKISLVRADKSAHASKHRNSVEALGFPW